MENLTKKSPCFAGCYSDEIYGHAFAPNEIFEGWNGVNRADFEGAAGYIHSKIFVPKEVLTLV